MLWVHGSALRHVIVKGAPISRRVLSTKSRFFFKERNLRVVDGGAIFFCDMS